MAVFNKFNATVEHLASGVHQLIGTGGSTANMLAAYLANAAAVPSASADAVKADLAEIATGNGYTGPVNLDNVGSRTGATVTVTAKSFTVAASGGAVAAFQHVVIFNDTPTSPADPLVGWFDRGSELTLNDGESFTVKFNDAIVGDNGTLFTLA